MLNPEPTPSFEPEKKHRLSSTALYTAQVWHRNHFTTINLAQTKGFWFYQILRPINWVARVLKGIDLETILVQRHRIIDSILEKEIESGRIKQVIEIGAGFSPRGTTFASRYAHSHGLVYIETDLPQQISMKRSMLQERVLILEGRHYFLPLDAFSEDGFEDLMGEGLDPNVGTAVISEGLLNYFPTSDVEKLWQRVHGFLARFPNGVYLADTQTQAENFDHPIAKVISGLISWAVKRSFYHHFRDKRELQSRLNAIGFPQVEVVSPQSVQQELALPGNTQHDMVHVIYARTQKV